MTEISLIVTLNKQFTHSLTRDKKKDIDCHCCSVFQDKNISKVYKPVEFVCFGYLLLFVLGITPSTRTNFIERQKEAVCIHFSFNKSPSHTAFYLDFCQWCLLQIMSLVQCLNNSEKVICTLQLCLLFDIMTFIHGNMD